MVERNEETLRESEALWRPHLPLGRFGRVEDVAEAVLYVLGVFA